MIDTPADEPIAFAIVYKCRLCGEAYHRGLIEAEDGRRHLAYLDGSEDEMYPSTKVPLVGLHHCSQVIRGVADVVGLAEVAVRPALAVVGGPDTLSTDEGIASTDIPEEVAR